MARIEIIDRKTALRTQGETTRGDVHVCITDRDSKSPHRAWWITEQALNAALAEGMSLDDLDRLVGRSPRTHRMTAEYPLRSYHLPLLRENAERAVRGERGEQDEHLWRFRRFFPTARTMVWGICRWDGQRQRWMSWRGGPLF